MSGLKVSWIIIQIDEKERDKTKEATYLETWTIDGAHDVGPAVRFEHLDQDGTGPGSLNAFVRACNGQEYFNGAGAVEGLKAVCTIDAMYRSAKSGRAEPVRGCDDL